jgi:hypothetical protein
MSMPAAPNNARKYRKRGHPELLQKPSPFHITCFPAQIAKMHKAEAQILGSDVELTVHKRRIHGPQGAGEVEKAVVSDHLIAP